MTGQVNDILIKVVCESDFWLRTVFLNYYYVLSFLPYCYVLPTFIGIHTRLQPFQVFFYCSTEVDVSRRDVLLEYVFYAFSGPSH